MAIGNSLNIGEEGVVYFNGTNAFSGLDGGTAGKVLTSNGTNVAPSFQTAAGITTLTGDTGSATGSNITLYANNAGRNSGSSVKFVNSGSTSTLSVTIPTLLNTFIGENAGKLTTTGTENTSLGSTSLTAVTSGTFNTAVGSRCLQSMQNGVSNTAMGLACMRDNVSGQDNVGVGDQCLTTNTSNFNTAVGAKAVNGTGSGGGQLNSCFGYASGNKLSTTSNCTFIGALCGGNITGGTLNDGFGYNTLIQLTTGSYNICIGSGSGDLLTSSESSNLYVNNSGVAAESNVIRIGRQGSGNQQQNKCFIAGISGVTVAASVAVLIDGNGQLGTILSSERYKENIVEMPESVSVLDLKPVQFNYKADENKIINYGLIAEDVAKDFPYLAIYKDGQPETVKYHELCVFLLAEIKRLEKRVSKLEGAK